MTHRHDFDPLSGWCSRCGLRDDNRLVDARSAAEYRPGPTYTPEQLAEFLHRTRNETA